MNGRLKVSLTVVLAALSTMVAKSSGVSINEFMAVNNTVLADEDGQYSDWIEIHNHGTNSVDLAGWYLTDTPTDLTRWSFPAKVLLPNEYLIVFASDKNRRVAGAELHTSFKLSGAGEFLALVEPDGTTIHHAYAPAYPVQVGNVSFGVSTNGLDDFRYFAAPTPGAANGGAYLGLVADTKFSVDRGFYSNAFEVAITSATPGAVIRYTTDLTKPTFTHGTPYSGPIVVTNTTILRAFAWKEGWRATDVDTQTYLFPAEVLTQDGADFTGYSWGARGTRLCNGPGDREFAGLS